MEIFDKILAITFSLMILFQGYLVRLHVGTWLFPACIFSLFWFGYTFIPLVVLFFVPVNPLSIGYIFLCCVSVSIPSFFVRWEAAFLISKNRKNKANLESPFIRFSFWGCVTASLTCLSVNTVIQGFSLYDVVFNLLETAAEYTARRYSDDLKLNVFGQLSIVLAYPAAIFGGILYDSGDRKKANEKLIFFALAPAILVMLIQGAKGMLFLVIALFWSGVVYSKLNRGEYGLVQRKSVKRTIAYAALIFPVVVVSFLARGLYGVDDNQYVVSALIKYFASYSSAHIYAFSDWFSSVTGGVSTLRYVEDFHANGFYTFMAIFYFLGGGKEMPPGIYDEYFHYGELIESNIYTMYRGLVNDFGLAGSFLFMMTVGMVLSICYWRVLVSKNSFISSSIVLHSIGCFYTSYIISLLIWNSVYASFLIVLMVLFVNSLLKSGRIYQE